MCPFGISNCFQQIFIGQAVLSLFLHHLLLLSLNTLRSSNNRLKHTHRSLSFTKPLFLSMPWHWECWTTPSIDHEGKFAAVDDVLEVAGLYLPGAPLQGKCFFELTPVCCHTPVMLLNLLLRPANTRTEVGQTTVQLHSWPKTTPSLVRPFCQTRSLHIFTMNWQASYRCLLQNFLDIFPYHIFLLSYKHSLSACTTLQYEPPSGVGSRWMNFGCIIFLLSFISSIPQPKWPKTVERLKQCTFQASWSTLVHMNQPQGTIVSGHPSLSLRVK